MELIHNALVDELSQEKANQFIELFCQECQARNIIKVPIGTPYIPPYFYNSLLSDFSTDIKRISEEYDFSYVNPFQLKAQIDFYCQVCNQQKTTFEESNIIYLKYKNNEISIDINQMINSLFVEKIIERKCDFCKQIRSLKMIAKLCNENIQVLTLQINGKEVITFLQYFSFRLM